MSKKHYIAIAAAIKFEIEGSGPEGATALENTARRLARWAGEENPRFDHGKFLRACGVQNV